MNFQELFAEQIKERLANPDEMHEMVISNFTSGRSIEQTDDVFFGLLIKEDEQLPVKGQIVTLHKDEYGTLYESYDVILQPSLLPKLKKIN